VFKHQCDHCDQPATHHLVENKQGEKTQKHFCDYHAAQEGLNIKTGNAPINELLTNFVKMHGEASRAGQELACESCGMTFAVFREKSLLGCPNCYAAFESALVPLLERAHGGGTRHLGKVPSRADAGEQRYQHLLQMRKRLTQAVSSEDYELAARLRDEIRQAQEHGS